MPTSFICERSAEYILVPKLCTILSQRFSVVIPFFFWISREGSNISRACDEQLQIRILAAFARRPKIVWPRQQHITVKINYGILRTVELYEISGIPVLCGTPVITSIMDLSQTASSSWFLLLPTEEPPPGVHIDILIDSFELTHSYHEMPIRGPLGSDEIINIAEQAKKRTWTEVIDKLTLIHRSMRNTYWRSPWFAGYYKPFYLMLIESSPSNVNQART